MDSRLQSRAERYRQGKAFRANVPLERHADFSVRPDRDVVAIVSENDENRLSQLLPERYRRMAVDPFSFFRGAAAVMAEDLAQQPSVGVAVQACGDCHLMNFGAFNTPEENIAFNVNDFDETLPGVDFTIDLKRLVASVAVAAETAHTPKKRARALAMKAAEAYRKHILALSELSPLEAWHSHINLESELERIGHPGLQRSLRALIAKARGKGLEIDDNFPHLVSDSDLRISDKPPTIFHFEPEAGPIHLDVATALSSYRRVLPPDRVALLDRYELRDLAFKAVGVGSVGTRCLIALFVSGDAEPLFLQIKEAQTSVLEKLGAGFRYPGHQGQRVVEGHRMMQVATDIFLGWTQDQMSGRQFYIRRLRNHRLGSVADIAESEALSDYASLCGRTLARAHARSGDAAVIAGYMGKSDAFDDALASFAMLYADQTTGDHAAFVAAKSNSA
jgi:uncharacterized protein (DUF2252 family)